MVINRRRAPSSEISREKKLSGHVNENDFSLLVGGTSLTGTRKSDVLDTKGRRYSVKSGKKWQVFLYGYKRIKDSRNLNILKSCLDAFPEDANQYFLDRVQVIDFKERYIKDKGRDAARKLSNLEVAKSIGKNSYIDSKEQLAESTAVVCEVLRNKSKLESFLAEALFNIDEVKYLAIKDQTFKKDNRFKVFAKNDVIATLGKWLFPEVSNAGKVPEDYNVAQQKTLLRYEKSNGLKKNIVEIEIRNDSDVHYRQVRFNMYSKDTLTLLHQDLGNKQIKKVNDTLWVYGSAIEDF